jgi:hypothetical protein
MDISDIVDKRNLAFIDDIGNLVGYLDFTESIIKFNGNLDESAKILFEFVSELSYRKNQKRHCGNGSLCR